MLNDLFTLIARGKIEINVGPFTTVFAQKPLEEQFHANGINSSNLECVADSRVGRGTSSLHEETALLAVANDFPDNQKIAGKAEPFDECQFMPNLRTCLVEEKALIGRAIAFAHSFVDARFTKAR